MLANMSTSLGNACLRSLVSRIGNHTVVGRSSNSCNFQQTRSLKRHQENTIRIMYQRARSFDKLEMPEKSQRSQMLDWNYRSEIFAFSRRLHENLSEDTLRKIFIHPSYAEMVRANQEKLNLPHTNVQTNVELMRSGEELLNSYIKPYLRHTLDRVPEDGIVHITQYLTSDEILADIAKWIGCKEIILSEDYPPSQEVMANTVRALVGGIHSEEPSKTRRFIVDIIISYLNDKDILDDVWVIPNPRETLNLILANSQLPAYESRVMFQTGVGTLESCHVIGLYSNQRLLGSSAGETLAIAEHCAAIECLKNMFDLTDDRPPFLYGEASEQIKLDEYQNESASLKTWRFKIDHL